MRGAGSVEHHVGHDVTPTSVLLYHVSGGSLHRHSSSGAVESVSLAALVLVPDITSDKKQ